MRFKWLSTSLALCLFATWATHGAPTQSTRIDVEEILTLPTQPTASVVELTPRYESEHEFLSQVYEAEHSFQLLGIDWQQELAPETAAHIELRFRRTNSEWSDWNHIHEDQDGAHSHGHGGEVHEGLLYSYFITDDSDAFQYRVEMSTEDEFMTPKITNMEFDYVDGGELSPLNQLSRMVFSRDRNDVMSREEWGADESLREFERFEHLLSDDDSDDEEHEDEEDYPDMQKDDSKTVYENEDGEDLWWPQEYSADVSKIVIHHTASDIDDGSYEQQVRAIYRYHTVSRAWGDIGYNYIIDPDGVIYEGRAGGDYVIAAHAGGYNTGSIGIALLGNYEHQPPTGDMVKSLVGLVYEKADDYDIDADAASSFRGDVLPNVLGHGDLTGTQCPGDFVEGFVEDLASAVGASLDSRRHRNFDDDFAYEESGHREMLVLETEDDRVGVLIKIKNTGTETWDDSTYLKISGDADLIDVESEVEIKQSEVEPGESATFSFVVESQGVGGLATYDMKPVFNGTERSRNTMDLSVFVEQPKVEEEDDHDHHSENDEDDFVPETLGDVVMSPDEKRLLWVQITNNSGDTWNLNRDDFSLKLVDDEGFKVGTAWTAARSLRPGTPTRLYFYLTAPDDADDYDLEFQSRMNGKRLSHGSFKLSVSVTDAEKASTEDYEDAIRIRLTPDDGVGNPVITANGSYALYDDDRFIHSFSPNSRVRITDQGEDFYITSGSYKWTLDGPVRVIPTDDDTIVRVLTMNQRPSWNTSLNDNKFRGSMEVQRHDGEVYLINELPLEDYLKGIAEVSNGTPVEKIKTIIVLARSYASYYLTEDEKFPGKPYDLDDDPDSSQKYLGYGFESRSNDILEAVDDTEGVVVTYDGEVVKTPYFSQSDGTRTKSAQEVWGWTHTPWLKSVSDEHCEGDSFQGHGVGLSGCGAEALAREGWTYDKIIQYYYTGVELDRL